MARNKGGVKIVQRSYGNSNFSFHCIFEMTESWPSRFVDGLQRPELVESAEDLVLRCAAGEQEPRHGVVRVVGNPGKGS